jgi:NADH-quinone oxidoreductase subunit J
MGIGDILFAGIALLTVVSAAWVAFSRNIVHSAFALLGTFFGVAGLYVFLSADFLAVVQALVYVGGILVLILFAVMLTGKIGDVKVSNRSAGVLPGLLLLVLLLGLLGALVLATPWQVAGPAEAVPTTAAMGNALLSEYVLPFEVISVLLIAALVGAVTLVRKEEDK